jgi:peptidoglycan L-alanyl-D-glutamate endopeptidase CwlK
VTFKFSARSVEKLNTAHPDLQLVMMQAITLTPIDFAITEGIRTVKKQRTLVIRGASKTMNSRHLTGHAVDVAAYIGREVRWDWPLYELIADSVKQAAKNLKIPIEWGGDWKRFRDGPHFQLPWEIYP